jgi:hypothetical protein
MSLSAAHDLRQIAERLGIAKGSSHYHVRVLAKVGLIHIVETRKVRGVEERYYGMVAPAIALPDAGAGAPEFLMRHALADLESAPASDQKTVMLKHARLSPAAFEARLHALIDELTELSDPADAAADLFVAFYRPQDPLGSAPHHVAGRPVPVRPAGRRHRAGHGRGGGRLADAVTFLASSLTISTLPKTPPKLAGAQLAAQRRQTGRGLPARQQAPAQVVAAPGHRQLRVHGRERRDGAVRA